MTGETVTGASSPATTPAPEPVWVKPLAQLTISQPYGGPNGHPGVDFSCPVGTPVMAARAGTVNFAGEEPGGYGNLVKITHAGGYETRYAHLSRIDTTAGATVHAGQGIGLSGGEAGAPGAGNSTGPHLHFEVRLNGATIDPMTVLDGAPTLAPSGGGSAGAAAGDSGGGLSALGDLLAALANGHLWERVGLVALGVALIYLGARILMPDLFPRAAELTQ